MDLMQNVMLAMMQNMTANAGSKNVESIGTSEGENFRTMLEKQGSKTETKDTASAPSEKETAKDEPDELDETAMQELAAMQQFVADNTVQIVTVETEEPVEIEVLPLALENADAQGAVETAQSAVETGDAVEVFAAEQNVETIEQPQERVATQSAAQADAAPMETVQNAQAGHESAGTQSETDARQEQSDEDSFVENVEVSGERTIFREVETAPVKVSETTSESELTESVETQINEKLTQTLSAGETRVELQLNPEHLGKITIELTQSSDGALHVSLFADNHQTRLMLERDTSGLQGLLSRNVQEEVLVEVPQQQQAQQQESYEGHRQQEQQQEQQRHQQRQQSENFLDQLRLGLIPQEETA